MTTEALPQLSQINVNLADRLRHAAIEFRTIVGRIATASLLVASGALATLTVEATVHPAAAHADSITYNDLGYPWKDAPCKFSGDPAQNPSCKDPANPSDTNNWYDWGMRNADGSFQQYRDGAYEFRNCTDYVRWRVESLGGTVGKFLGNGGQWYDNSPASQQSLTPKPGDAAVKPGAVGHVAFVESVNSDGTITVSEYNHDAQGHGDMRIGTPSSLGFTEFVDFGVKPGDSQAAAPAPPFTPSASLPYAATRDGQPFMSEEGWVYTRVGGSAFPIKHKNDWTDADTRIWGTVPAGRVPTAEVHDHEAGWDGNQRVVGAHPPGYSVAVYEKGNPQQWYFVGGRAFPIGGGELDDLGVRDKAFMIPAGRLGDFEYGSLAMPNGALYRYAGTAAVRQAIIHQPDGSTVGYWVNNGTVLECLELTQNQRELILPQAARSYLVGNNGWGVAESWTTTGCSFPSGWVLFGPGGQEQWRIEGDNTSTGYMRRYFPSALTTYLHTSGNPEYHSFLTTEALNSIPQGPDMPLPDGIFFVVDGNGDQFKVENGVFRKIPWPDMNACLGNTSPVHVPGNVASGLPQGPQMSCTYENKVVVRPGGQAYYMEGGRKHPLANPAVRDCIIGRRGTGAWSLASDATIDGYVDSSPAYCNYGAPFFVHYQNDGTVYLANPNGTLQHVGSLCLSDSWTTQWTFWRVQQVPNGELDGYTPAADWFASTAACNALRAAWDAAGYTPQ